MKPALPMQGADSISFSNIPVNGKYEMMVFPNPAKSEIFVYLSGKKGSYQLTLLDMMGKPIKTLTATANQKQQVAMQQMPAGVYYLKAEYSGQCLVRKIILTK
jgi:hypothetical protein